MKSPFIPVHENRFSPLVTTDTETEDITEIGDTTFVEVQRSIKKKIIKKIKRSKSLRGSHRFNISRYQKKVYQVCIYVHIKETFQTKKI